MRPSVRYIFIVATSSLSARAITAGDELGKAVCTWRKACGEMGCMMASCSLVICLIVNPLGDSNPNYIIAPCKGAQSQQNADFWYARQNADL